MNPIAVCGGLAMLLVGSAHAATCMFSVTDVAFGAVPQMSSLPVDVQGTITVQCQADADDLQGVPPMATVSYNLEMDGGSTAMPLSRAMMRIGGSEALSYNLYVDPDRQGIWGDGSGGTQRVSGEFVFSSDDVVFGVSKEMDHVVFARVPANISEPPGEYADMVTVALSF